MLPPIVDPGFVGPPLAASRESTFEAFKRSSFIIKICLGVLLLAFLFHPILSFVGPWRDNDEDLGNVDYDYHLMKAQREDELPSVNDDEQTRWLDDWPDSDLKTATIAALVLSLLAVITMIAALVLICLWMLPFAGIAMIFAALLILIAIICYVAIENLGSTNPKGMFNPPVIADQDTDLGWGAWMAIIAMILLALAGGLLLAFTLWTRSWKKMNKVYHGNFAPAMHSPHMAALPTFPGGPAYPAPSPYQVPGGMPMMMPNDSIMMGVPPAF